MVPLALLGGYGAYLISPLTSSPGFLTYYYTSQGFNLASCEAGGFGSPPCVAAGNATISLTFGGVAAGFSGTVKASRVVAWSVDANNVGVHLKTGNVFDTSSPSTDFTFVNGQITKWNIEGSNNSVPATQNFVTSYNGPGSGGDNFFTNTTGGSVISKGDPPLATPGTWTNPKMLVASCDQPGHVSCGNPIDIGSGNKYEQVLDYETAGQNKLGLIRYYNSAGTPNTYATSLGPNWRTNYDRYLHIFVPGAIYGVTAERPDGSMVNFTSSSGTYTPDTDVDLKLTVSGSTWTLTDQNDTSEIYFTSGSEGVLQSVTQRNNYTQALTYSHGQIAFASDSYGRKLTFGYSSGLLSTVSTPEFTSGLTYSYITYSSAKNSRPSPTAPARRRIRPTFTRTPAFPFRSPGSPTRTATATPHGAMTALAGES